MEAPVPETLKHLSHREYRDKLWRSFGGPEPIRPWGGPISEIYYGWCGLGRDMNGTTLHSERAAWLETNGWTDPGEEEAGHFFFSVLESAMSEIREELYPRKEK